MIKGSEKLTPVEIDFIQEVNRNQKKAFGTESNDYDVIETWKDENNVICVRLKEGNWFHYLPNGQWY